MKSGSDFEKLTPEVLLDIIEAATGIPMTGLTIPLPSYINRVYEIQSMAGERFIVKFYRPGRWTYEAIEEEHQFLNDCAADEIPVVTPVRLINNSTLGKSDNMSFALFPKKAGRAFEINSDEDFRRVGSLIGRIHMAGQKGASKERITLRPDKSTKDDLNYIIDGGFVTPEHKANFEDLCSSIVQSISDMFENTEHIRIHGDCHRGNLLERPGEGIMAIDFDDMMTGPPVQDLWLLLPDQAGRSHREIDLLLEGYEQFREFDYSSLRLIEPLRFMRIIYFLAWWARQAADYDFKNNHQDWGTDAFWQKEILDLGHQYQVIMEHKVAWEEGRFFSQ